MSRQDSSYSSYSSSWSSYWSDGNDRSHASGESRSSMSSRSSNVPDHHLPEQQENEQDDTIIWGCHLTRKRFNLCDGSSVHPDTPMNPLCRMSWIEFRDRFLLTAVARGDRERSAILRYMLDRHLPAPPEVTLLSMPMKQHIRFGHDVETWIVAKVNSVLFVVAQDSEIYTARFDLSSGSFVTII